MDDGNTVAMEGNAAAKERNDQRMLEHVIPLPLHLRRKLSTHAMRGRQTFQVIRSPLYNAFMKLIPEIVLWVLQQGYSLLYSDTDVVVLANPFPAITQLPPADWYLSIDGYVSVRRQTLNKCALGVACGGILYARQSNFSLSFAQQWIDAVYDAEYTERGNQKAYNAVIYGLADTHRLAILPCDLFPNGGRYNEVHSGVQWRPLQTRMPVMVHNNWIIGKQNKIETFKRWGLWMEDITDTSAPIIPRMDPSIHEATKGLKQMEKLLFRMADISKHNRHHGVHDDAHGVHEVT